MPDIKKSSDKTLVSIIVSYRVLNINKSLAILAMEELKTREDNGSKFDYISEIDAKIKECPPTRPDESTSKSLNYIFSLKDIKNV